MKEQLISYETAKLAKKKGFNIETVNFYGLPNKSLYIPNDLNIFSNHNDNELHGGNRASAPTQSLLNTWLRQVHSLFVFPDYIECKESEWQGTKEGDKAWQMNIFCLKELKLITVSIFHPVFEVALEDGLKEALKRVK